MIQPIQNYLAQISTFSEWQNFLNQIKGPSVGILGARRYRINGYTGSLCYNDLVKKTASLCRNKDELENEILKKLKNLDKYHLNKTKYNTILFYVLKAFHCLKSLYGDCFFNRKTVIQTLEKSQSNKIENLIPTKKEKLNKEGNCSEGIFDLDKEKLAEINSKSPLLKIKGDLVVKKGCREKEFLIGAKLSHKHLVKSYALFIDTQKMHHIVMEKVNGNSITEIQKSTQKKFTNEPVKNLVLSLKDVCLYLFDNKVYWSDVNHGNLMIDKTSGALKIVDFGGWKEEENNIKRAWRLFLGSIEAVGWILKSSEIRGQNIERNRVYPFIFPKDFFEKEVDLHQVMSQIDYKEHQVLKTCFEKISKFNNNEEIKKYLASYFDMVLEKFEKDWEKK